VLGGGPIGSELAQAFARLGSKVTQVEMLPRIMTKEDPEFSEMVASRFREDGIDVLVDHKAKEVRVDERREGRDRPSTRVPRSASCATRSSAPWGRAANTTGFGLEELGIPLTKTKTVEVNEFLQATYPNIYACGDVARPPTSSPTPRRTWPGIAR